MIMLVTIQSRIFCLVCCVKKCKIGMYNTIILPVVLYGCENWSPTLRKEHRLTVFQNRVLRRILGPKGERQDAGEGCISRSFVICTLRQSTIRMPVKEDEMGRACSTRERRGMHIGYWWEIQKERDY
jgi:hypothetical protein